MNLDNHLNIIFKNLNINNQKSFLEIWQNINIETKHNFEFNSSLSFKRIVRSYFLLKYFESVKDMPESILEVGVLKGFSGLFLEQLETIYNNKSSKSKIFLIDSFEGLSEIKKEDYVSNNNSFQHDQGHFKVNYEEVKNLFSSKKNVQIIKGWIPEIFKELDSNNLYKFIHLDVDLYEPTITTLNYIFDKVVKGGIIITDDFDSRAFPGNRKAWQEFFTNKNILNSIALPSGQAVYIKDF
tara:strand:- start:8 stop:727 length:720 start_codon:yes stop_codon:yes gene_type:complete